MFGRQARYVSGEVLNSSHACFRTKFSIFSDILLTLNQSTNTLTLYICFVFQEYILNIQWHLVGTEPVRYHSVLTSLFSVSGRCSHYSVTCWKIWANPPHYNDVIMGTMASQITSLVIVYSTIYSSTDQRKHQSSASLAIVRGIHRSAQMASNAENVSIWWRHHDHIALVHVFYVSGKVGAIIEVPSHTRITEENLRTY